MHKFHPNQISYNYHQTEEQISTLCFIFFHLDILIFLTFLSIFQYYLEITLLLMFIIHFVSPNKLDKLLY
jgi:hypothetical protein